MSRAPSLPPVGDTDGGVTKRSRVQSTSPAMSAENSSSVPQHDQRIQSEPSTPPTEELLEVLPHDPPLQSTEKEPVADVIELPRHQVIDLTCDSDDDEAMLEVPRASPIQAPIKREHANMVVDLPDLPDLPAGLDDVFTPNFVDAQYDYFLNEPLPDPPEDAPQIASLNQPEWQHDMEDRAEESARLAVNLGPLMHESLVGEVAQEPEEQRNEFDSEIEDADARATFRELKKRYEQKSKKGQATVADDIEFRRAEDAEKRRRKQLDKKRAYQHEQADLVGAGNDDGLFFSEGENNIRSPPPYVDLSEAPARKYRQAQSSPLSEQPFARDGNRDLDRGSGKATRRDGKRGRKPKETSKKSDGKSKVTKSRTRKDKRPAKADASRTSTYTGPEMSNIPSLLHNDIVGNARANQGREAQHVFKKKDKRGALAELIASIPVDQRNIYAPDKKKLELAVKKFRWKGPGSMQSDGAGGWKLKGTNTSLYSYQVLGCSFMRDREEGSDAPFGGLCADAMGLGKTVQLLVNMVEGRPKPQARNQTTLVVCPSSLCNQWLQEVQKHVQPGILGEVMIYRSGSRVRTADPVQTLRNCGLVITTYNEVMRNFPACPQPKHLVTQNAIDAWWREHYEAQKGPLLRIQFFRVILDEAHIIKNHKGRTSRACVALSAKYRWALTGSPLSNTIAELFAYFKFLRVDNTGCFETFKENFCKQTEKTTARCHGYLRKIMLRRTGADELFGRPILSLTALDHQTIAVDFTKTEKAIYQIVRSRFITRLNEWSVGGQLQKNHRNVFVMLLRLRQLCAHVMLIASSLKDLLEAEDLEKLWRLTAAETMPADDSNSAGTMTVLRKYIEKTNSSTPKASQNPDTITAVEEAAVVPQEVPNNLTGAGAAVGNAFRFRGYLRKLRADGSWEEVLARSLCHKCREVPQNPQLTIPCQHIYCEECLLVMLQQAQDGQPKASCVECSEEFTEWEPCKGLEEAAYGGSPAGRRRASADSEDSEFGWLHVPGAPLMSTKTQAIHSVLTNWFKESPGVKCIMFSQFLGMIKILQRVANYEGWDCCLFTGQMTPDARDKSIGEFRDNPEKNIMLCSMRAGSLGLNLTMASRCLIVDPWWNESVEDQAYSRIYRIGQASDVEVKRIVIKDSIDTQLLLKMQERKSSEIRRVLGHPDKAKTLSVHELMRLFGPVRIQDQTGLPLVEDEEEDEFIFVEDEQVEDESDAEHPGTVPAYPFETS